MKEKTNNFKSYDKKSKCILCANVKRSRKLIEERKGGLKEAHHICSRFSWGLNALLVVV